LGLDAAGIAATCRSLARAANRGRTAISAVTHEEK